MTKSLVLAAVLTCATIPAFAQSGGWDSQTDAYGNTYSQGTGSNQGWSGTSQSDAYGNTYSNFTGPNGQSENCTSSTDAYGNTTTNCN